MTFSKQDIRNSLLGIAAALCLVFGSTSAHAQFGGGAGGGGMMGGGMGAGVGGGGAAMGGGNVGTATSVSMGLGANTANAGAYAPNAAGVGGFGGQNVNTAATMGLDPGAMAAGGGINPSNGGGPRRFGQNFNTAMGMDMNPGTPAMSGGGQVGFQGFYRNLSQAGQPGLFNRSGGGRGVSSMFSGSNRGYGTGRTGGFGGYGGYGGAAHGGVSSNYGVVPPAYRGSMMFGSAGGYTHQVRQSTQPTGGAMYGFPGGNYNRGYFGGGGGVY